VDTTYLVALVIAIVLAVSAAYQVVTGLNSRR